MICDTTSKAFFDRKYRESDDPWDFASSAYEQDRYARIVAALRHRRYGKAFEPGCSIGVLTSHLASLCESVEAMDISPTAVMRAAARCTSLRNVTVRCGKLPECVPEADLDLVVFSEIGYYFSERELSDVVALVTERMASSGVLLAAHWLGVSRDHSLSGDQVHAVLSAATGLEHEYEERRPGFRIDRWRKM
jgi:hypothetical protein